mgnify:CR=1 FL=1
MSLSEYVGYLSVVIMSFHCTTYMYPAPPTVLIAKVNFMGTLTAPATGVVQGQIEVVKGFLFYLLDRTRFKTKECNILHSLRAGKDSFYFDLV